MLYLITLSYREKVDQILYLSVYIHTQTHTYVYINRIRARTFVYATDILSSFILGKEKEFNACFY